MKLTPYELNKSPSRKPPAAELTTGPNVKFNKIRCDDNSWIKRLSSLCHPKSFCGTVARYSNCHVSIVSDQYAQHNTALRHGRLSCDPGCHQFGFVGLRYDLVQNGMN